MYIINFRPDYLKDLPAQIFSFEFIAFSGLTFGCEFFHQFLPDRSSPIPSTNHSSDTYNIGSYALKQRKILESQRASNCMFKPVFMGEVGEHFQLFFVHEFESRFSILYCRINHHHIYPSFCGD